MDDKKTIKKLMREILAGESGILTKADLDNAIFAVVNEVLAFKAKTFALINNIKKGNDGRDGRNGIDGKDGRDGRNGIDGRDGLPGRAGKDGSPDTGEEIIQKINKDKSNKVIKKEHVEGLQEIEDLARTAEANSHWRGGGGGSFTYIADLSSQTDGITKVFTVPPHTRSIMVVGSDFPTVLFSGNGYTETSATTITLTTDNAPSAGSQLGYMYILV